MKLKLNIQGHQERINMIASLAQSGYKTWVEEDKKGLFVSDYYVCFNLKNKTEYSGNKIGD